MTAVPPLGAHAPDLMALHPVNIQSALTREPTPDARILLLLPLQLPPAVVLPCAHPGFSIQARRRNRRSPAATSTALPSCRERSRQQPGRGQPRRVPGNSLQGPQALRRAVVPRVAVVPVRGECQRAAVSARRAKCRVSCAAALHTPPVARAAT